jgi:hypothetical protein
LSSAELKLVTPNALVTGGFPFCPTGCPGTLGIWNVLVEVPAIRLTRVLGSMKADM